jgi:hypothetical protein
MMSMLCNCCVRELLILTRTWFTFGLPSKTGCDTGGAPDSHCTLSGAPSGACSDSARTVRTIALLQVSIGVDHCAVDVAPLAHRTIRCHTGQSGEL